MRDEKRERERKEKIERCVFTSFLHNFSFKRLINEFNEEFINCIARFHTL